MEEDGMQNGKRFERVDFRKKNLKRQRLRHTLEEGEEEGQWMVIASVQWQYK